MPGMRNVANIRRSLNRNYPITFRVLAWHGGRITLEAAMHTLVESLESRTLFAADAVLEWNSILLNSIRAAKTPPPYAARNMAIVQIAVFDAVNAIDGGYQGYATQ